MVELNIGHFLIGQAIIEGLPAVVSRMKLLMLQASAGSQ
jgi:pyridoxine 5'-phosphate synthase PdxJ